MANDGTQRTGGRVLEPAPVCPAAPNGDRSAENDDARVVGIENDIAIETGAPDISPYGMASDDPAPDVGYDAPLRASGDRNRRLLRQPGHGFPSKPRSSYQREDGTYEPLSARVARAQAASTALENHRRATERTQDGPCR